MNPIAIEQTQQDLALAMEVHRSADIESVRLVRSKLVSRPLDDAPKSPIRVKFTVRSRSVEAPKGRLRIEVDFRMGGEVKAAPVPGHPTKMERVAAVDCTFAVDYRLREGFEPSEQQVRAFRNGNVIFNCWPYFRQYLQESVQRMGFPPLTAPFLRVQPKPPKTPRTAERKTLG